MKQRGPNSSGASSTERLAGASDASAKTLERREFFRRVMHASYAVPAVATVFLASLQPTNPSGDMMTTSGPTGPNLWPGGDPPRR